MADLRRLGGDGVKGSVGPEPMLFPPPGIVFDRRCLPVGIAAVESVWSRLCAMAGLRRLGGDEVGGGSFWAGVVALPLVRILRSKARSRLGGRSLVLAARTATLAQVALDSDGRALDSDSRTPACCSEEVQQVRCFKKDRS